MSILEQHWNEEATNLNQTKFYKSNITVEEKHSFLPSLPSLSQLSDYKIPLMCAGGALLLILIAGIGTKLVINRGASRPSGNVNLNINTTNSANNENTVTNDDSTSPSAPETIPPPPFNYPGMDLKAILDMKADQRSPEEQDLVLLHIREKKELEASRHH